MATFGIRRIGVGWRTLESFFKKSLPLPTSTALLKLGVYMEGRIKIGILTSRPGGQRLRPNAPATIRKKGSSKPLVDTAKLLQTITSRKVGRRAVFVGIPGEVRHTDPRRAVALIGRFHEFLTKNFPILPRREFLGPALRKELPRLVRLMRVHVMRDMGFTGVDFGRLAA